MSKSHRHFIQKAHHLLITYFCIIYKENVLPKEKKPQQLKRLAFPCVMRVYLKKVITVIVIKYVVSINAKAYAPCVHFVAGHRIHYNNDNRLPPVGKTQRSFTGKMIFIK